MANKQGKMVSPIPDELRSSSLTEQRNTDDSMAAKFGEPSISMLLSFEKIRNLTID